MNGNGLPDDWELEYFGSPTGADPAADPDGDTMSNEAEYTAGTDPRDVGSFLRIESIAVAEAVIIRVGAISNRTYTVEYAEAPDAAWRKLADLTPRATNRVAIVTDSAFTARRYYRLVTPRQP